MKSRNMAKLYKGYFKEFYKNKPEGLLHFASHSQHAWPDASLVGHNAYWKDSITLLDNKWDKVFGEVIPSAKEKIRSILNVRSKDMIVFGGNTFDLTTRLLSTFKYDHQIKILTSESEYHSFNRLSRRYEEEGAAIVDRIPLDPYTSFEERFLAKAKEGILRNNSVSSYDVLFFSHVFFNTGIKIDNIASFVDKLDKVVPKETIIVVDGYHSFCCFPFDFSPIEKRAFYLAGGYKYGMAGESCGFMVCPPDYGKRPRITGWLADYEALEKGISKINYENNADRFLGATFDPSAIYRFEHNWGEFFKNGITIDQMHQHIKSLQKYFMQNVKSNLLTEDTLLAPLDKLGNYLTFKVGDAKKLTEEFTKRNILVDYRGNNIRIGFAIYHDEADVDELINRINDITI